MADDKGDSKSFDWRDYDHILNPIKDQLLGNCCFAFTICLVLEALHNIKKKGDPILLSTQDIYNHLIKDKEQDDNGRTLVDAIDWVRYNGCILDASCPYVGNFNRVDYERKAYLSFTTLLRIDLNTDMLYKKKKDKIHEMQLEEKIRQAHVAAQMLWVEELNNYKGGIYSGPKDPKDFKNEDGNEDHHAVTIVGFGQEVKKMKKKEKLVKYWIIQNSHGDKWGEGGYAKINRAPCHGRLLIDMAWALGGLTYFEKKEDEDEDED